MKLNEAIQLSEAVPLSESRRNPHLNPRIPFNATLSLYAGRRDVFVHFSNIQKIGTNPQSIHNTPLGIYSYPIDYLRKKTDDFLRSVDDRMEYASNFRYMYIFESTAKNILDLQNYYNYSRDVEAIKDFFASMYPDDMDAVHRAFEIESQSGSSPASQMWHGMYRVIRHLGLHESNTSYMILHKVLGYHMAIDRGDGIIHPAEPTQAVYFNRSYIRVLDMVDKRNKEETLDDSGEKMMKSFGMGKQKTHTKVEFEGGLIYADDYAKNRIYSYEIYGIKTGVILYSVDLDATYYVIPGLNGGVSVAKDTPNAPNHDLTDSEFFQLVRRSGFSDINEIMNHLLNNGSRHVQQIADVLGRAMR